MASNFLYFFKVNLGYGPENINLLATDENAFSVKDTAFLHGWNIDKPQVCFADNLKSDKKK